MTLRIFSDEAMLPTVPQDGNECIAVRTLGKNIIVTVWHGVDLEHSVLNLSPADAELLGVILIQEATRAADAPEEDH